MTRRPNSGNPSGLPSPKKKKTIKKHSRPFWLPASNYYVLAIAITIAFFFLVWGILHDENEDAPWIPAGLISSFVMVGAVFLREVVLKKARARFLSAQKRLDDNLASVPLSAIREPKKLTIEKNAAIIKRIKLKSEAAQVLGKLSDGHREVFEICDEYLLLNESELKTVGSGSPRLAALRRGREIVKDLHRFHVLSWAEIETRALTQEATVSVTMSEKLKKTEKALTILNSALQYYPDETQLIESELAVKEFIASIKVSHWIELAERAVFKGNHKRALSYYKDALFFLARENIQSEERTAVAEKINEDIAKLRDDSFKNTKKNDKKSLDSKN